MIAARAFAHTDVAVFGLAASGLASVRALKAGGARVHAWDESGDARRLAANEGAHLVPVAEWPWDKLKAVVLSQAGPGDLVLKAMAAGVELIGEVELFAREIGADSAIPGRAPVIAVAGSSAAAALIAHILGAKGHDVQAAGEAVLNLDLPNAKTIYVLALTAFEIEHAPSLVPDVAVLSDIVSGEGAAAARLLTQTSKSGQLVIGVDDAKAAALFTRHASGGGPTAIPVSVGKILGRGVFVVDGALYDAQGQRATKVMDLAAAAHFPAVSNWRDAALAFAATKSFTKDNRAVAEAIREAS
jgi:UDP-N-acetylmuramoylalanine--D-glutamate ligase